jgi:ribosomal protein S27AE
MNVTQPQIIRRGLANRCPNCGGQTLFREDKLLELNRTCPSCGLKLEREEGFFLGAMALNYGVTCCVFLTPTALLWYYGVLGDTAAIFIALVGAFLVPVLLYRSSRSWQLMLYYFFLPQHLPANRRALSGHEDENV